MPDLPLFLCCVSQERHSVNVFSESPAAEALLRDGDFTHWIPEYRCTKERSPSPYKLVYHEDSTFSLASSAEGMSVEIHGDAECFRRGVTLPYLTSSLLEVQRQAAGETTAYAAAVAHNGKGVLLFGRPGSGKTSVSLALCRTFGFRLIANDITLIGYDERGPRTYGGTKFFCLRRAAMERHHPDLLRFFGRAGQDAPWLFSLKEQEDPWITRTTVFPEDLDVSVEHTTVPIVCAFLLHLDPTCGTTVANQTSGVFPHLFLYENFSRAIRRTGTPLLGGPNYQFLTYLPSLDRSEFHEHRVALIKHLLHTVGLEHISGDLPGICQYICDAAAVP